MLLKWGVLCRNYIRPGFSSLNNLNPYKQIIRPNHQNQLFSKTIEHLRALSRKLFTDYLFLTNMTCSGFLWVGSDFVAQRFEMGRKLQDCSLQYFDYKRMQNMFLVGLLQSPLYHITYAWLDRKMPDTSTKTVIRKILVDQFFVSPLGILLFFFSAGLLGGETLADIQDEIKAKFIVVFVAECAVWPAFQFFNFRYLPGKFRVLFYFSATAIYNAFVSYVKHNKYA